MRFASSDRGIPWRRELCSFDDMREVVRPGAQETEFLLVPPSLIALACVTAAARGLRVRMSVAELCALTRSSPAAAELVARHVERVLARETQHQEPRARTLTHAKPPQDMECTNLPNTPTDVQDVRF
ncbi:hypothetical protein EVAR_51858_1 [Eumeta japonica]|uniref:Cyclin C-terminal domain-containing protein n=1 Tax=Eumeta variegata TaxID=151549 RepID=A0A4C1YSJ3_EUMVA|nr:hypothetical protein EVAR_51858_1 [Eumeta japonica]